MNGWEKIIAPGVLIVGWLSSFEWRLRSKVGQKTFDQNREDINRRLGRGVERFDKIDTKLEEHSKMLIEVCTIVKALAKKNGIKNNDYPS